ncbi:DNA-(apurinic or apyrimidinic site) endonuclease 2 isoform X2 [Malania oleifera]|uniref:DNA-(apurinic or apyrimidinic site) endonuclease 2 isoform X2 n=1 Tax=Malania oleifera TaxID=397392 RepID=UPI0025AD9D60|nr:DNA-(apurinic or apyrimidinic site) endonuclease 2 isoform X2 [Malania oleifera]
MKIVTYNVNGLRPRISQFGSLLKLLDSFDADIICFQETKLSKQELTADLAMADGYESFFSCTRTVERGRVGYAGVVTFCRVKSAFSSNEVALPLAAEEGFTGLIENSQARKAETCANAEGLEGYGKDELLKVDSEGRCVITDHGHFVLFNIYGPRAECDDMERTQFKITFFKILQKRWESLLRCGRRIFVAGDLNIAPAAIDSCRAGPDFEKNECRRWFRSMLVEHGGPFFDVFRAKHPERTEAYTCWPQSTGAEEFNYGTRIDHILSTGSCLHQDQNLQTHDFITCHVKECDILAQYKRWKPGETPRWRGGRSIKLEGSDHAPVYMSLIEIPEIPQHSTPSLSARYIPKLRGFQQTIVSVLMKRQVAEQSETDSLSCSSSDENIAKGCSGEDAKRSFPSCSFSSLSSGGCFSSPDLKLKNDDPRRCVLSTGSANETCSTMTASQSEHSKSVPGLVTKKKARQSQWSQLSLRSFFKKDLTLDYVKNSGTDISLNQADISMSNQYSNETATCDDESNSQKQSDSTISASSQDDVELNAYGAPGNEKNNAALLEWQRIQQLMQNSIPLCKGHNESCVPRIVKKAGPNYGRRFFVCARAEGPASNPEANCGYFKWAASNSRRK